MFRSIFVFMLISVVKGMPQGDREENLKERRAHPSLITNCIAENSKQGLDKVRDCLNCFEETGDPLSAEGLPKAKACTEAFLPRVNTDCAAQLSVLEPENKELGAEALQCFASVAQMMAAEECIARKETDDVVETLTDAVICMIELLGNMSIQIHKLFEKEIKKEMEKGKGIEKGKPRMPKENPLQEQMMFLVSKHHCEIASSKTENEESCQKCFDSIQTHPTSNLETSRDDHVKLLANCSAEHLSPKYDECTTMMQELATNKEKKEDSFGKQIFFCYMRVVTKDLVEECSNMLDIQETSAKNLLHVMECGSYRVSQWMRQNVRQRMLEFDDYEIDEQTANSFYNEI